MTRYGIMSLALALTACSSPEHPESSTHAGAERATATTTGQTEGASRTDTAEKTTTLSAIQTDETERVADEPIAPVKPDLDGIGEPTTVTGRAGTTARAPQSNARRGNVGNAEPSDTSGTSMASSAETPMASSKGNTRTGDDTSTDVASTNVASNDMDRMGPLTVMDQGSSEEDIATTQRIRRALVDHGDVSFRGRNVKVITRNGRVALVGKVESDAQRELVERIAQRNAGDAKVRSRIQVASK